MSIGARNVEDTNSVCESKTTTHADLEPATIELTIGDSFQTFLCTKCARNVFNAVGFMITSITGESVAQLAGVKKRSARV